MDKGKKGAKAVAEKGGKDKKQGEREIGSRPSSQVKITLIYNDFDVCYGFYKAWLYFSIRYCTALPMSDSSAILNAVLPKV